ncbi:NUDIX domain-containing protein [Corallincola spongiicola]|uniref:Nudix hydrolase domain-containing protein n=1 Tax=Corallincola spongiicola TaxID=2520508 RepID=A0ABY1WUA1_9GAMM|nr:NUDIX domain-containing protein [Corallincola spongiicola]TAA48320.1 hypothetical protein EXY25_03560 [Corallincola spongiicola]
MRVHSRYSIKTMVLIVTTLFLTACSDHDAAPCPYQNDKIQPGNAGCLIFNGNQLLTVTHRFTGTIGIPGGTGSGNEPASCTAWRESREELGGEVVVGSKLTTLENGFVLFHCQQQSAFLADGGDWLEIAAVNWTPLADINAETWRYPAQWAKVKKLVLEQMALER